MLETFRSIDQTFFYWCNTHIINQTYWLDCILKILSTYLIYAIPLGLLIAWFFLNIGKNRKIMLAAFLAGAVAWQVISRIIGMFIQRQRPFVHFAGAKELIFHVPTYSFPSDHASFLAAITTYFYLAGYRKIGHLMFTVTLIISFTRVIVGTHWLSDVFAGWVVGILAALAFWHLRKPIERWILNPILWVMEKIHLA